METNLIARRDWNGDAAAFIEFDPNNGKVRVYGKFYVDEGFRRRGYGGPTTEWLEEMPANLIEEAKKIGWREPKSPEMAEFCENIWKKAKEVEDWFKYEV